MQTIKRWLAALAVTTLAACGGGSSEDAGAPILGGGSGTSAAADLIIEAPVQMSNTVSSTATIVVTTVDAGRNTLAGAPVSWEVDNGAFITAPATTDESGKVQATLSIGADRSDRVLTVRATSGTVTRSTTVQVIGTRITATVPPVVAPGAAGQVQYRVVDRSGGAMSNQAVTITAAGLSPSSASGNTGPNGEYTYSFVAPDAAGSFQISASVGGASDVQILQVRPVSTVPDVTDDITSASVSVSPSVVAVNAPGSQSNRAEVRALFLGANNAPVRNVRVRFDLADDVNSIGGSFSTGDEVLYSDANGVVTTAYIPGTRSSPTDGVTVRACYGKSDADPDFADCTTFAAMTLTVANEALGVSIGTNELIVVNELSYVKRFLVTVTDSAGAAKADVNLSVSLDLIDFRKGFYQLFGDSWAKAGDLPTGDNAICSNEDANRNGVLEVGEDANASGRLDPGRSDVTVRLLDAKTAADGTAVVEILYAKSFATWIDADLTVAASGVGGTEGRTTYRVYPIPADAAAIKNKDVFPAFGVSPFGAAPGCTNTN